MITISDSRDLKLIERDKRDVPRRETISSSSLSRREFIFHEFDILVPDTNGTAK